MKSLKPAADIWMEWVWWAHRDCNQTERQASPECHKELESWRIAEQDTIATRQVESADVVHCHFDAAKELIERPIMLNLRLFIEPHHGLLAVREKSVSVVDS